MDIPTARLRLIVNGKAEQREVPLHWTLLQVLRDALGLQGTREGCGEGACGSCTVLVDGELVRSCLYLGVRAADREVLTVEGLANDGVLDPVQRAFLDQGAVQCGFCTAGFLMTTRALLADHPDPSEDEIREYLSGNLCRCGGYPMIMAAVREASRLVREAAPGR
jgi:aerobic carbon-monoxide dehydrogenase small subunit